MIELCIDPVRLGVDNSEHGVAERQHREEAVERARMCCLFGARVCIDGILDVGLERRVMKMRPPTPGARVSTGVCREAASASAVVDDPATGCGSS